jgi:hypothetical protein
MRSETPAESEAMYSTETNYSRTELTQVRNELYCASFLLKVGQEIPLLHGAGRYIRPAFLNLSGTEDPSPPTFSGAGYLPLKLSHIF